MHISGNELRKGDVIKLENKLWQCMVSTHRTPGNLRAFVQAKLRNIMDGSQKEFRFSSTEKLEKVDLHERPMQYLYEDANAYVFMDTQSYEQAEISKEIVGDNAVYLTPDLVISIGFIESSPTTLRFPQTMEFEVTEADPEIKGATASASYKSATLSNGQNIQVPQFVKIGDIVKINTESGEYLERAKK